MNTAVRMACRRLTSAALPACALAVVPAALAAQNYPPATGAELVDASGERIYAGSCANCHGMDGTGLPPSLVGFEEELPDFSDCDFAAREPDGDWIAVAHEGGPVRGFSEMMPAFRGALTEEQLARVMGHIRTLCTDEAWPRGELNLPRALLTEKAYPEDEWVIEADFDIEDGGDTGGAYVYEHRFGPRSQLEVAVPFRWRREGGEVSRREGEGGALVDEGEPTGDLTVGNVSLGWKHAFYHSLERGAILSIMGEAILPTSPREQGGEGALEIFLSAGQLLPSDAFLQAQGGMEVGAHYRYGLPLYEDGRDQAFARVLLGLSRTEGPWGRTWSPMLEFQAKLGLEDGGTTTMDLVPQVQVALNTRQHVLANVGVMLPVGEAVDSRRPRLFLYLLLDWFDGGFFEGW